MDENLEFDNKSDHSDFKQVYKQRWLVLGSFSMFAFITAVPFVQYSAILDSAGLYFDKSPDQIVWFSNIYYLDYIFFGVFFVLPTQKYLAQSIIFGSALMVIGTTLVYVYEQNYWVSIGAYSLFGIAQIFQMIAPVFIADRWFPPHERTLATTFGLLVTYLGLNYAFIFPALYLRNDQNQSLQTTVDQISTINLISLILAVIAFIVTCLFTRSKPPTPPSASASDVRTDTLDSFKTFFRDSTTFLDFMTLSVFSGVAWSFISVISVLLEPFNYSQPQIGLIGLCFQLSGTISGITAAIFLDKQIAIGQTPSYDLWMKVLLSVSFIGIVLFSLTISLNSLTLCCVLSGMVGFGLNAYFPIALQSMVEKLYPCSELAIATGMFMIAVIFGFASNYLVIIPAFAQYGLWILSTLQCPFIIYLLLFYKTELNRTKKEKLLELANF